MSKICIAKPEKEAACLPTCRTGTLQGHAKGLKHGSRVSSVKPQNGLESCGPVACALMFDLCEPGIAANGPCWTSVMSERMITLLVEEQRKPTQRCQGTILVIPRPLWHLHGRERVECMDKSRWWSVRFAVGVMWCGAAMANWACVVVVRSVWWS